VLDVRRAVRAFPPTGYSDLRSQVTRAAESIAHNIVEGCASASRKEFAHHLNVSIKSTSEVDYQLQLARDYGILPYDIWRSLAREVVEIRKMLTALRRTVVQTAEAKAPQPAEPMAPNLAMPEETEPDA
jgi:four helix bundle protein